jgi:hypothetical protein
MRGSAGRRQLKSLASRAGFFVFLGGLESSSLSSVRFAVAKHVAARPLADGKKSAISDATIDFRRGSEKLESDLARYIPSLGSSI